MKYATRVILLACFISLCILILLYNSFRRREEPDIYEDLGEIEQAVDEMEKKLLEIKNAVDKNTPLIPKFPMRAQPVKQTTQLIKQTPQFVNKTDTNFEFQCVPLSGRVAGSRIMDSYEEIAFSNAAGGVWKQGWELSYDNTDYTTDNPLEVFVVPHSHNDPGWIKTFWDYYTSQTRNILNNIVDALNQDSDRKFIWAEISYLDLWWKEQTDLRREQFKKLVSNGQLELVTAGWVMNDEANTHYSSMIDQMFEGHEWTMDHVSPHFKPKSSWCIDPFGTSPTMSYILNRAGIPFLAMQRVHYEIKKYLANKKRLEFPWRQSWAVGMHDSSTDTLTHLFPFYSYDIPHTCGPDPKICCQFDFKRMQPHRLTCPWGTNAQPIADGNIQERASTLIDQYKKHSTLYSTNKLLIILGDDFRYETAEETRSQFENYERLFRYINNNRDAFKTSIKWSSLTEYFQAMEGEKDRLGKIGSNAVDNFQPISGDFFTYADRLNHYWSGYYTSRPFYKEMDRELRANLRTAEILFSLARIQDTKQMEGMYDLLVYSRRNAALFQHHDGVTGTAKTFVNDDYGERMLTSLKNCQHIIAQAVQIIMGHGSVSNLIFDVDEFRTKQDGLPERISIDISDGDRNVLFVNSLGHERRELVSLRVTSSNLAVICPTGETIPSQIAPVLQFPFNLRENMFDLFFEVSIPPLGASQYRIEKRDSQNTQATFSKIYFHNQFIKSNIFKAEHLTESEIRFENSYITATFDRNQGTLRGIRSSGSHTKIAVEFLSYGSNINSKDDRSGAYLFIPNGPAKQFSDMNNPKIVMFRGKLISKICARFKYLTHCSSLAHTDSLQAQSLHFENFIDLNADNEEVVMRLETSVLSKDANYFYTDLNGFTVQRRKYYDKLGIQGNFYPMPTLAFIEDSNTRISLHSKQSLGVGSLLNGCLEVMLDRRPMLDDSRGLEQGVTDNKATVEKFSLLVEFTKKGFENPNSELSFPSLLSHFVREALQNPISKLISKQTARNVDFNSPLQVSTLTAPLPCDLQIVNMRGLKQTENSINTDVALIMHKFLFNCELPNTGIPINHCSNHGEEGLDLTKLFSNQRIVEIKHMKLTLLEEMKPKVKTSIADFDAMDLKSFKLTFATKAMH